jgi:peptide/nickel transport system substrate-binding protein
MMKQRHRLIATVLLIGSLNLAAPAMAGKVDNTLNVAFTSEVTTLDNYKETTREGLILARLLYDSLLYKDPKTGQISPLIAESYRTVDDTTYEFVIRSGIRFHDGSPLTVDDVVYTLNLVSSKDYGARYQPAVDWIDKAEKIDDRTVRLHSKRPFPLALEMLAGNVPIYPKAYYDSVGSSAMGVKPVGSGPYRLTEIIPGSRYVFERFADYFDGSPKGKPAINKIVVRILPESNSQYAEILNGGLDWIWRVPPDDARNLDGRNGVRITSTEIMRYQFMNLNPLGKVESNPFSDVRVRQAVMHAIDRPAIVRALVGGASKPIETACNPIQFGCATDVKRYAYDVAKAKELLAEAGFPKGLQAEMVFTGTPRVQAEALAASLDKIGIKVNLNEQQYAAALTAWRQGKVAIFLGNWGSYGLADVAMSTGIYFDGGGDDLAKDTDIDSAIRRAGYSMDRAQRESDYKRALTLISEKAFQVPLWTFNVNCAVGKDLILDLGPDEFVEFYRARWK